MSWIANYRDRASSQLEALFRPPARERLAATTPVVVVPSSTAVAVGIARDLGRLDIPVIAADHEPNAIGLTSRFVIPLHCRDPRYDEGGLIDDLVRIGEALPQKAVLFPSWDDHVFALSRHADRLSEFFILPFARWDVMRRLFDKEEQMQAAWRAGVDTPVTFFIHSSDDLLDVADEVPYPALFKPLRPQEMRRRLGMKVVLVPNRKELEAAYEKSRVCGPLMLQEVVPGTDQDFYTFGAYHDASSRPLGMFVSRKVRQHPRLFGESRIAETLWVDDVADAGLQLLGELQYHGVSGTEFKRDPRDGHLKLMEVNARHWLHHSLATAAGVNLSYVAYSDALGRSFTAARQRDGVRWLDSPREARDSLRELARGELQPVSWLKSFRGAKVDAVFSLDDPLPGVRDLATGGRLQVRHEMAKLARWLDAGRRHDTHRAGSQQRQGTE